MASTNKTTNYELSQYIGTDKPTYLGDYNSDMSKIDAGMHANANDITTVAGNINSLSISIGTLTNLTTDEKTNLVGAINEVDSHVDTNTTNIGSLSSLNTTNKSTVVNAINEVNDKTSPNILTAIVASQYTVTSSGVYEKLPLTSLYNIGNKLSVSNNNIVIGSGVNHVKISASVEYRSSYATENKYVAINQNGTAIGRQNAIIASGSNGVLDITPFVASVSENDNLTFEIYSHAQDTITGSATVCLTYITVEVID